MGTRRARFIERGGPWLLAQLPLMLGAIALAPWLGSLAQGPVQLVAVAMLAGGIALVAWSRAALGRSFTPYPRPIDGGNQVSSGPYRFVRHPIYAAVVMVLAGWALLWQSPVAAALVGVLAVLLDLKARREEAWLTESYPGYAEYKRRTKKLVPFLY